MELNELLVEKRRLEALVGETKETLAPLGEVIDAGNEKIKQIRNDSAGRIYALQLQIEKERQEAQAAMLKQEEELASVKTAQWDMRTLLRQQERDLDSIQRQIEQAKRAAESQAEWAALEKRWDLLTMSAPWREWAKDHQIEGGKKITYEGRLILGDTMGLGKTLTALIACDMIEAATKDASEEHPVEFGTK